jgi:hypothetical protein
VWRDPYTHKRPEQRKSGTWYVHDDGARAPTYSGIDLTSGSEEEGLYGGLLIRELSEERRWVFQRIVRGDRPSFPRRGNVWRDDEKEIIRNIHTSSISAGLLQLAPSPERRTPLYIGPRIGLRPKPGTPAESPEGLSFRLAPLRIATWPTSIVSSLMTALPSE